MLRVVVFVDGPNLYGSLRALNLDVTDYQSFYGYVHDEAVRLWQARARVSGSGVTTQLRRVYWYAVGSIDQWDLSLPQSRSALEKAFQKDREVRDAWLARIARAGKTEG